jgi:MFS transporter, DHA1 family, multidrug resistance protein
MTDSRTESRASGWVWMLVLFTFAGFIETVFYGQLSAFTPLYLPNLGIRGEDVPRWTGLIASVTALLGLPFLPFWGALADRYARKPVIIRSFIVEMAAAILLLLAGSVGAFMAGRTLTSLALGNSGLMLATLAEHAPAERQGLAFSIMNSAGPVGAFVGPLIGGPIVDHWGFRSLLEIDTGLLVVVALALGLGYRDHFQGTDRGPILKMAGDAVTLIFRSRRLRSLFPALFVLFAGWMLGFTYVPLAISQLSSGQDQATTIGIIMGAGGLVSIVVSPYLGLLADRHGYWRVLLIAAAVEAALWPLPGLTRQLIPFGVAWTALNAVSSGVFAISFIVLAQSADDTTRGRVMSFAYLPANIGLFLGPAIGSLVTRYSVFAIFPTAAVLTVIGILLLLNARQQAV